MNQPYKPFGRIPDFFAEECTKFSLPLTTVADDTAGFVAAILAITDPVKQVHMRRYAELIYGFNFLRCYLQTLGGLSPDDAGRVANEVLLGLRKAGIPLNYREMKN